MTVTVKGLEEVAAEEEVAAAAVEVLCSEVVAEEARQQRAQRRLARLVAQLRQQVPLDEASHRLLRGAAARNGGSDVSNYSNNCERRGPSCWASWAALLPMCAPQRNGASIEACAVAGVASLDVTALSLSNPNAAKMGRGYAATTRKLCVVGR